MMVLLVRAIATGHRSLLSLRQTAVACLVEWPRAVEMVTYLNVLSLMFLEGEAESYLVLLGTMAC